jgi:pSer/pThr/pTyr-binding forkhead associated (FHA) protein
VSDADEDVTIAASIQPGQILTITLNGATYAVEPSDAPITIGREFPAQIQVDDPRISRAHLRLETHTGRWVVVNRSTNGVYLHRRRQASVVLTDGVTLHLGNPEGIPVRFAFSTATGRAETLVTNPAITAHEDFDDDDAGETTEESEVTNPGIARAGAAVSARRRELNIAQRTLAKEKILNAGALIAFEKGRSWPRRSTLDKLEQILGWEPGTIARIRWGDSVVPGDPAEQTVALTNTVQAPLMAQAVEVALGTIGTQIDSLPTPSDADFIERVTPVLADLRKLEQVAANAARTAKGAPEVALVLSAARRAYRDLMLRAASSPHATFGQQLFAARHRAELSTGEAATAARVSVEDINAAEADTPTSTETAAAVRVLLASLSQR